VKDRIKQLREGLHLSQAQFAQRIQKSPGHISNIEVGRVKISDNLIDYICETFSVNKEWFVNGKGEMFCSDAAARLEKEIQQKCDVGGRIKAVRNALHLTQMEFSEKVGYSKPQIAFVETGKKTPSNVFLHNVAEICGVSEQWLVDGVGSMNDRPIDEKVIRFLESHPDVVDEIIEKYGLE